MKRRRHFTSGAVLLCVTAALIIAPQLATGQTLVKFQSLAEMCNRAGSIFRGTVVSASPGTVEAGGGTLRTIDYVIEVTEAIKGSFESKGDTSLTTIRMVAGIKGGSDEQGEIQRFSKLADLPQLEVGGDYLLLATTPGSSGLSTTVGLGQGCFSISEKGEPKTAVNESGNHGLYDGPVAYHVLADDIRAALGQ